MSSPRLWGRLTVTWLFMLAVIPSLCRALRCLPCSAAVCPPAPRNCTGGIAFDVCGCCKVCTKNVNETCGGPFGILGSCGEGMECAITPSLGSPITGSERGLCREIIPKNCDNSKCELVIKRKCPPDSVLVQNLTNADKCCKSKNFQCVCNLASCKREKCLVGFEGVVHHKAEGRPGACCDQYVCQPSEKCRSVMCPWTRGQDCPADSYKLPSVPSKDGCCYQPQGCACKRCPLVLCPLGQKVHVLKEGSNQPANCCTEFQCVNETDLHCYNGISGHTHQDGESWQLDKCSICTCQRGITFCKRETCHNSTICPYMEIPENECCPVCRGCMTESGKIVNNSDSWRENDCTTCTCVAGIAQCNSQMCETKCLNPRKIPGQCCPVCNVNESMRPSPSCPDLRNCSLRCPSGLQYSQDGCYKCKCKPENCYIDCRHGYKIDREGKELCECSKLKPRCPSLSHCKKQCTYGFKVMRNGCAKCRCNKCPPFKCSKQCTHGYLTNQQGCQLCKCKGGTSEDGATTTDVAKFDTTCLSLDGLRHEDGESWHDGCRLCYCYNGQEMCALISCPRPLCSHPVFRIGDCCPTCAGNAITLPTTGRHESCQSATGLFFLEGETWHLDNCTECICHNGSVLCETHLCPPLLCNYPKVLPHRCCPVCQDENGDLPSADLPQTRMCRTSAGYSYEHGQIWRASPCQSCTCRNGQIHCFSQTCPPLTCNKTVLRKGNCCPKCIDYPSSQSCLDGDTLYHSGEMWTTRNCTHCSCRDGKRICNPTPCPTTNCKYLIRSPDQCCPACIETTSTIFLHPSAKVPSEEPDIHISRERDVQRADHSTTIIIIVLAIMVIILLLLFVFGAYKFHRRRQCAGKSLEFVTGDMDTVKPVHVKLLGYEPTIMQWDKSVSIIKEGELLTPLHKHSQGNVGSNMHIDHDKTLNMLRPEFDRDKCKRAEENIYL